MRASKMVASCASAAVLALTFVVAAVPLRYLTEYSSLRLLLTTSSVVFGLVCAAGLHLILVRLGHRTRLILTICLAVLILVPLASMRYPGTITHSRFGLTVYGIVPVPFFDVKIGSHGLLWFRDKTHRVALDEARALLSSDVEVLIIGTGWEEAVKVDRRIATLPGVEVHILPTPAAFALFNKCRAAGRKVVMIAHSTC